LQKEDLALAVDFLINRMPIKKAVSLTRLLERKSVQTVALWQKGLEIPRMNTLLQMCHLLDISLQQLFLRESDGELFTISEEHKKFNRDMNPVQTRTPRDPEELRRALETMLASDEEPFPSIKEVAQRLGYCNKSSLYKLCPELAREIAAKYRKHNPRQREPMSLDELRHALEAELASSEEPPPSLQEVAQRLGYCGAYELHRRFPELANVIVTKYQKYNPSSKKRMRSIELQQALESIVASNEEPPPSIQEVAYRLGYHGVSTLYARFPDLSHAITAKYQKQNRDRREPMDAEVLRQSLEAILASNEEPPHPLER
jgi:AraC-like DNA-binding protein